MVVFYDSTGAIKHVQQGNVPATVYPLLTSLYLDDVQYSSVYSDWTEYTIQNGVPVSTPTPASTLLANAQQAKIASLEQSYLNATQTFTSTALGTSHTYKSGLTDMILLGNEYSFVTGPDYDNNPINWYTIETDSEVAHTAVQFRQVWKDGRTYVQSQDAHKANLKAQVNAATTVDAVNAVTW